MTQESISIYSNPVLLKLADSSHTGTGPRTPTWSSIALNNVFFSLIFQSMSSDVKSLSHNLSSQKYQYKVDLCSSYGMF